MLPLPGASSSTWAMWRARVRAVFAGADLRICSAFWLFGLINNVLYVIILSAALDLIGPEIPKGVVLLADVIPSFITKLCAPYFIHTIPYSVRIILFSLLSAWGMFLIALTPSYTDGGTISIKLAGVVLASLSSGGGELSFLGLTHFYGPLSLAAWGSGTGGAGLVGAGAYSLATTTFGLSVQKSLFASAFLPIIMLVSFFFILPPRPLSRSARVFTLGEEGSIDHLEEDPLTSHHEDDSLLNNPSPKSATTVHPSTPTWLTSLTHDLRRARGLFIPYMLPLLLVYIAEYTINLGLFPVLLFPLELTPFTHFRSFYPFYSFLYQIGVFISRSSLPLLRIHHLYPPSLLQILNFILLLSVALYNYLPPSLAVYIVFLIIFWEGLLGGAVYVNTFAKITDEKQGEDREWSLGAVTVSDSAGICIAGWLSLGVESGVCKWQVGRGWDACRRL